MSAWTPRPFDTRYPQDDGRLLGGTWYSARIEELGGTSPESYRFVEVEQDRTTNLAAEKVEGVRNTLPASPGGTDASPAYAIDGGTYAVDDIVFVRRSQSALPNWDIRGPGMPGVGVEWCADYATQSYAAVLDAEPGYPDADTDNFQRFNYRLDEVKWEDGNPVYDYRIGRKTYILFVPEAGTGLPYTTVCIPPNSGSWVLRWGAHVAHGDAAQDTSGIGGYLVLGTYASVVAVDADGAETSYVDGLGQDVSEIPSIGIPVVSGQQIYFDCPGNGVSLGQLAGPAFSGNTIGQQSWQGATAGHEKLIVSGDETIRLAIKLDTRWRSAVAPDPGILATMVFTTFVLGTGQGGTYLSIENVSTAGCVGCGEGSGSGSGSGSVETGCCSEELAEHPDMLLTIPDGPYAGAYAGSWGGGSSWVFAIDDSIAARMRCEAGVWIVDGFPASSSSCNPFLAAFDGSILGATTDVTAEVA